MKRRIGKAHNKQNNLKVVELFAGVGGFRLGLCGKNDSRKGYKVIWSNQWEPSTTVQHAAAIYRHRFHRGHEPNPMFNEDIFNAKSEVPEHDLLVGGFPCQDYSVARTLSHATGIEGKKGVLWWAIRDIAEKRRPKYLMLENVDRLLKSPAMQRGRDFGIILATLSDLGYIIEWRIINAADYGMPQRRRRTFILAYHKSSPIGIRAAKADMTKWVMRTGILAKAFPVTDGNGHLHLESSVVGEIPDVSEKFHHAFENSGMIRERTFITEAVKADYHGPKTTLGNILEPEDAVLEPYLIDDVSLPRWQYLKGAKKEKRTAKTGFEYEYIEGPVAFPDSLDKPSRTIITGEGGSTPARHKHVVLTSSGRYRRLMPIELERLCMFPDRHTEAAGISDQRRAFFMGNALVVGVIDRLGRALLSAHRRALQ